MKPKKRGRPRKRVTAQKVAPSATQGTQEGLSQHTEVTSSATQPTNGGEVTQEAGGSTITQHDAVPATTTQSSVAQIN